MENKTVYFDKETCSATAILKGLLSSEEFKIIANKINEISESNRTTKILTDSSELMVLPIEAQHWVIQEWVPKAKASGLKHLAYVTPSDIFGQLSLENIYSSNPVFQDIEVKTFPSVEEARFWLKNI